MGVSEVFVGVVYAQRKGEKERGGVRDAARVRPLIGALGRPARVRARATGGRKRRGTEA